ncbi:MAG TPA: hypothetical protein VHJ83_01645, partial [Micromonosporaceae bacterium]|nr:hypothetical protein [Micromonosporaceae bacterium]
MTEGSQAVYREGGPSGWRGYVAVRLTAIAASTENPDYASLDASARLRQVNHGTVTYLRRIAQADPGAVVELRWLAGVGQPVRTVLLGRVDGADPATVVRRAGRLREVLLALPTYVSGVLVDGEAEVRSFLRPFPAAYRVELRKRRLRLRSDPQRPDLPPDGVQVVVPFPAVADAARSPEALLATAPYPVIAGVALRPHRISSDDLTAVTERFRWYQALAEDRVVRNLGLYGRSETRFAAVRLAAQAAELLHDAASRYSHGGFIVRIGLASAGPFPVGLDSQLADMLVPTVGEPGPGTMLLAQLGGGGRRYLLRAPATFEEAQIFDHNLAILDVRRWAPMPASWLEALATVVDAPEAATVFRLPLPVEPAPGPPAPSADQHSGTVIIQPSGVLRVPIGYGVVEGVRADPISLDLKGLVAVLGGWRGDRRHTVRSLLRWLWVERRVPFLVIEPGAGEYRSLLAEPEFVDLTVFTAGVERVAPLRLNPLDLPPDWLTPVLQAAFPAPPAAAALLTAAGAEGTGNTLAEVAQHSDDDALSRWCRQRASGVAGTVFDSLASLSTALLAERPVVVELAGLPRTDQTFAASLAVARAAGIGVPHVTVIADAHRLFDDSAGPLLSRPR